MRVSTRRWIRPLAMIAISLLAFPCVGQDKKPLSIDDYALWRSIGSTSISEKGDWIAYAYRQRKKDDELHLVELDGDKEYTVPRATSPLFSDDSRFAAYLLVPPVKEREQDRGNAQQNEREASEAGSSGNQAELRALASGKTWTWDNVTSIAFSKGSRVLVAKTRKTERSAKHDGTNLVVRYLDRDYEELIGSVASFSFSKSGNLLAYTVDAADQNGNGIYLINLANGTRRPLDNGKASYAMMTWSEEGDALAVLKGTEKKDYTQRENVLLAFTDLERLSAEAPPQMHMLDAGEAYGFPKNMVISEKGNLSWNIDRTRVFFGIKEQEKKTEKEKDADPVADVDIWHWKDDRLQSVQMIAAQRDRNRTDRSVFLLEDNKFVRLTDPTMRSIDITRDGQWGIGQDNRAYVSDWKEPRWDYYRVNVTTGERTLFLEGHGRPLELSPHSDHFLYWKEGHVWTYVLSSGETSNLTADAAVSFVNAEFDRPGEKPPYGVAGWSEDGDSVLLNHRYDIWVQPLDGSAATCLTQSVGSDQEIRFRYVKTDAEEHAINLSSPLLLSAYGQWTKKSGYYELKDGQLNPLIFEDKRFGRLTKAKSADRLFYTIETFAEFPDYYVSDSAFSNPRRVTDANPQQVDYLWGHRILFDYTNSKGVRLQGTLAIPDDYREGEQLPMLVNYYEKNSQNLHRYPAPRYASAPQFSGYVSNRYLVMQPDIHFNTRTSHSDMLECVEAAVKKVIELGYVDPQRIGLHGHSYSGQGSAHIATQTETFAAIVAGAAATDLISDFNQLWKSAGTNQHRYDIYGQGRFGTNPFDDFDLYVEQSAVFHVRNMNTPLLLLHGTDDGAVEWLQAVEFYNALRFNGKNVILLSYPGEGHGLRRFENQKDFQVRMREFFDHHLRAQPPADWIVKGVPFLKKKK